MPAYGSSSNSSIMPGQQQQVWNAEQPAIGAGGVSASQQVAVGNPRGESSALHCHGFFSGAPGAFEVDFQVADVDSDTNYQTLANMNITTVDATNQTFHGEVITDAPFARLLMRARANAVNVTAWIGR